MFNIGKLPDLLFIGPRKPRSCSIAAPAGQRNNSDATPFPQIARPAKMISKTITPDRSKIVLEREDHVKYWTRHFGVTKDELARAIERVGNSAAAVRKQLGAARVP
ncbi:MAG: DUF3606 domain-containing protein [Xanthobacteraceae bacterium]